MTKELSVSYIVKLLTVNTLTILPKTKVRVMVGARPTLRLDNLLNHTFSYSYLKYKHTFTLPQSSFYKAQHTDPQSYQKKIHLPLSSVRWL